MAGCRCGGNELPTVFACSGASDVGAITDQLARKLSRRRLAMMSCIAAIGGGVEEMVEKARATTSIIAIDGCEHECARRTLERAGIAAIMHFSLQDMGMEKGETPVSTENVDTVYETIVQVVKGVVKWGLLLFVGASLAYLGLGGGNPQGAKSPSSPGAAQHTEPRAPELILYYFHRTQRCPTCLKIEDLTGQIIQDVYAKELDSGRMVYQVINVDEPGNDSFVKEYELISSSVIAARYDHGKRAGWKSLDDVWLLTGDPAKFRDYVTREINVMLAAGKKS